MSTNENPPPFGIPFREGDEPMTSNEFGRRLCEERFDSLSILEGLYAGTTYILEGKTNNDRGKGLSIVTEIDHYFNRNGVTCKLLVTSERSVPEQRQHLRTLYTRLMSYSEEMRRRRLSLPPTAFSFVETVGTNMNQQAGNFNIIHVADHLVTHHPVFASFQQGYVDLHTTGIDLASERIPQEDRLRTPERLVQKAQELSRIRIPGVPDIWTTKYGGVSLQRLVGEKDPSTFIRNAFKYMQGVPRGDVFWQAFLTALFCSSIRGLVETSGDYFAMPDLARNLLAFQMHITEELFLPALDPQYRIGREFDTTIKTVIDRMDPDLQTMFVNSVISTLFFGLARSEALQPDVSPQEVIATLPLIRHALQLEGYDFPYVTFLKYLQRNLTDIETNLQSRFGQSERSANIMGRIVVGIRDIRIDHHEVVKLLVDKLGPEMAQSGQRGELSLAASRTFLHELTGRNFTTVRRVGEEYSVLDILPDSFPASLGLASIMLGKVEDEKRGRKFLISISDAVGGGYIGGTFYPNGEVEYVNITIPTEYGGLDMLIQGIVKFADRDLMQHVCTMNEKTIAEPPVEKEPHKGDPQRAYEALSSYFETGEEEKP